MTKFSIWLAASRPKTLWAAIVPVLIGTAMAYADGLLHGPAALAALAGALLIQIGTNLSNDYSDFQKGADTEDRQGPMRVTQAGLVTPQAVRNATILVFALSVLAGVYLMWRGGWPVLVIGVFSILSGVLYTAGPKPLGYLGLGDLFVLIFFGPVAVGGTYYVQALSINTVVLIAGFGPGLLSVALLSVNNLRDVEEDRKANKKTLAVRFGRTFARWEYITSVSGAALIPLLLYAVTGQRIWTLACLLLIPLAWPAFKVVRSQSGGAALNPMLATTAKLSILYSLILAITWIL
jgi:1,4-dihydroxy-2-naphthoate octaprenyltransferase